MSDVKQSGSGKWVHVGLGMLIMISIFMLADGIGKISHAQDSGWIIAVGGASSLILWISKIARDK